MVVTHNIICLTCNTKHLLKLTLGYEDKQHHSFPCTNCEEEIKFGIEGLKSKGEFRYLKNCEHSDFGYDEAIQVLLHPDLSVGARVVQAGDITTATLLNVKEMQRMISQKVPTSIKAHRKSFQNMGAEKLSFFLKVWSLINSNKELVAEQYAQKNHKKVDAPLHENIHDYINDFFNHFMGEYGLSIYKSLQTEWESISKTADLIEFHKAQSVNSFEIFEEFFELFTEFSQVFLYLNCGIGIDKNRKSSSSDFNKTKKYYSSAYEVVAKLLYVPAGINNIKLRGNANSFERLDSLQKYMSTGNGDKLRCFSNNSQLNQINKSYDNHLRNASFHNHMQFNAKKSKIIYTKNNGDTASVSYQEYLINCVKITEALAAYALFSMTYLKES